MLHLTLGKRAMAICALAMAALFCVVAGGSSATAQPLPTATTAPTASAAAATLLRAPEPNPKRGGILQWAGLSDSPHFDMHQCDTAACAMPQSPFFDTLLRYSPFDGGKEIVPDLAYKWEVSDDGLTYTFHLRDGVKFHDGATLTSEDVKATFDRIIFPPTGMISPRRGTFEGVTEVKAVDPKTVQFVLKAPRGAFIAAIASGWNVIERKKTLEDNHFDLKKVKPGTIQHPGTGPFILASHQAGEFWKLKRNPDYWNPALPYLDGIQFNQLPYGPATGAALLTGRVDYVYGAGGDLRDDIKAKYAKTHTVVVYPTPSLGSGYINHERAPFGDARVRRAINMVMDRCAIKEAVAAIREIEVGTWVIPNDPYGPAYREATLGKKPGYSCPTSAADIATAKQLLADAGYPDGRGFPKVDMMVRDLNFFVAPMAPMIQAFMKQRLNIESDIRVVHTSVWQEDQAKGNYTIGINGNPATLPVAADYWKKWFKTGSGGNWNRGASHPEFDALLQQLAGESDPVKVHALVQRGAEILEEWAPMLALMHFTIIDAWPNYVKGHGRAHRQDLFNDNRFDTVWLDK